jgi:plasmid stability protein
MMLRAEITEDERRELKSRAARAGVSFAAYLAHLIREALQTEASR